MADAPKIPSGQIDVSFERAIKVTVSDPATGEVLGEKVISNDYVLVCAGNRYLKNLHVMGRTHMLAVAVAKPEDARHG
jgi:hypothetical protein